MLKGIGHQKNIIVGWPLKIIQYFLYMCKWLFKTALLKRKVNVRFWLLLWKYLLILNIVLKAAPNFFSGFPSLSLVAFFTVYIHGTTFRVTGGTQKAKTRSWRLLIEGFSQVGSDFIEDNRNYFGCSLLYNKTGKTCKINNAYTKITVLILRSLKIFILWHFPFNQAFFLVVD